jgi:deazaflavin-dependent oxidoreductase (nitroreductase family)
VGWYANLQRRLGHTRWFAAFGARAAHRIDGFLARVSGGRLRIPAPGLDALRLTTTGRRSGEPRTVPLLYARDGERLVLAASNWGQAHHPAWSANLLATPRALVQIGPGTPKAYRARLVTDEERDRVWPLLVRVWPAYDTYAARAGRDIRVFVLEPAAEDAAAESVETPAPEDRS